MAALPFNAIGSFLKFQEWLLLTEALPEECREAPYPNRVKISDCGVFYKGHDQTTRLTSETARLRYQILMLLLPVEDLQKARDLLAGSARHLKELSLECSCTPTNDQCLELLHDGDEFPSVETLDLRGNHPENCAIYNPSFPKLHTIDLGPTHQEAVETFVARHPALQILSASQMPGLCFHPVTDNIPDMRLLLKTNAPTLPKTLESCTRNRRAVVRVETGCFRLPGGKFGDRWFWTRASYGSVSGPGNDCRAVCSFKSQGPAKIDKLFRLNAAGLCLLPLEVCRLAYDRYQYMTFGSGWSNRIYWWADNRPELQFEIVVFCHCPTECDYIELESPPNVELRVYLRNYVGLISSVGGVHKDTVDETPEELLHRLQKENAPHLGLVHQLLECFPKEDRIEPALMSYQNIALCGILDPSFIKDASHLSDEMVRVETLQPKQRCWNLPHAPLMGFDLAIARNEADGFQKDLAFFREAHWWNR